MAGEQTEPTEHEPDYRFTLANERTFLAWMRTALALLAGGIAVEQLVDPFGVSGSATAIALVSIGLSLVLAVSSYLRWTRVQTAMRRGRPLPHPLSVPVLATGITIVGAGVAALIVVEVFG